MWIWRPPKSCMYLIPLAHIWTFQSVTLVFPPWCPYSHLSSWLCCSNSCCLWLEAPFSHLAVQFFYWDWGALLFSVLEVFLVFAALLIWAGSFICYSPWFLRKSSSLMLGWKENISIHILLFPNDLFPLQLNIQSLLNVSSSVYLFYRGKDTCLA